LRASYQQFDSESDKEKQPSFAILVFAANTFNQVRIDSSLITCNGKLPAISN
jgi:hypothetical protein